MPIATSGQRLAINAREKNSNASEAGICSQLLADNAALRSSARPSPRSRSGRNALVVK